MFKQNPPRLPIFVAAFHEQVATRIDAKSTHRSPLATVATQLIPYDNKPIPRNPQDDDPYQLASELSDQKLWTPKGYHAQYVVRHAQLYLKENGRQVLIPGEVC